MPSPNLLWAAPRAAGFLLALFTAFAAVGQTPIGGTISGTLSAGVYHTTAPLYVSQTLTLNAGVIIKFTAATHDLTVDGTLVVNGTAGSPVIFTDDADDAAGGDTNSNGPSTGLPGAWLGLVFGPSAGASVATFMEVRYAGAYSPLYSSSHAGVVAVYPNITLTNCTIRDGLGIGLQMSWLSQPTVNGCTFVNNGGAAVDGVALRAVPGFSNNTASGNAGGNYLAIINAAVTTNLTLNASSMLNGAIVLQNYVTVPAGVTLTINAGFVMKFALGYGLITDGTVLANGTSAAPVIFTTFADDSAGGDTNGNGPSSGTPGSWTGLVFQPTSDASSLTWTEIRYSGYGAYSPNSNVELNAADITMTNCVVRHSATHGMDLNNNSHPIVTGCTFLNNVGPTVTWESGLAVANAPLSAVPGFTNNTASGNGFFGTGGNYIRVGSANVTGNLTIGAQSILGGALVVGTHITVHPTGLLTLNQGVVVKFDAGYEFQVNGSLHLKGTADEPVVLTHLADDAFGGDTNINGPGGTYSGSWRGLAFNAGALASSAENVLIRYPGHLSWAGLTSASANVTLRSVLVHDAANRGFVLGALAANPVNLVAWSCGDHGIHLTGGSFSVVHATVAATAPFSGAGIQAEPAWTGSVVNSISWANSPNFGGFGSGSQVSNSNGDFAGANGNINVDPLFVDIGSGDLRLGAGSPCIDSAQVVAAFSVQKDHDENSRILDSNLTGSPGADMGAYERAAWNMAVAGAPRIGTSLTFTVTGPPGESLYLLGVLDGVYALSPYGLLLAGAVPLVTVIPIVPVATPVGTPFVLSIANDPALVGLSAGVQTLTVPLGNNLIGNFTRLYRASARP